MEEAVSRLALVPKEIEVTRPDVVVFFTGRRYDGRLRETFLGVSIRPVSKLIAQVEHEQLPGHSYRTSHPNYLRLSSKWGVLAELATCVEGIKGS